VIHDLLARVAAAGVTLSLEPDGRVAFRGSPFPDLLAELRAHKAAIAEELRRQALATRARPPADSAPDHAGELAATDRAHALLRRLSTGLGAEVDAAMWRVLDRLLDARDLRVAERLWKQVTEADRRGIYSRLVGWLRALDRAGEDIGALRALVESGPAVHAYHDAGRATARAGKPA